MTRTERNQRLHEQFMGLCWHKWAAQVGVGYHRCIKCQQESYPHNDREYKHPNYFSMPDCWKLVEKLPRHFGFTLMKSYDKNLWGSLITQSSPIHVWDSNRQKSAPEAIISAIERMKGWQA